MTTFLTIVICCGCCFYVGLEIRAVLETRAEIKSIRRQIEEQTAIIDATDAEIALVERQIAELKNEARK